MLGTLSLLGSPPLIVAAEGGAGSWEVGVERLPYLQLPPGHTPGIVSLPGAALPAGQRVEPFV